MTYDGHGLHHAHRRKRIAQKKEKFPHPDKLKRFTDRGIYFIGIFGPLMTLPQLVKVFAQQNAGGLSLLTWVAYLFCASFWLAYGFMHREKPIIFTYTLWILLDIAIIVGIFMYG